MVLNITVAEVTAAGNALAHELGCRFCVRTVDYHNRFQLGFSALPSSQDLIFYFDLTFSSADAVSPNAVHLRGFNERQQIAPDLQIDPASISSFADVEDALRAFFAGIDRLQVQRPEESRKL